MIVGIECDVVQVSSDVTCIACKTILTDLQLIVRDPAIQIDLQTFLNNNLCEKLGTLKQTVGVTESLVMSPSHL